MDIAVIHPAFTEAKGGAKLVSFQIASALAETHKVDHYTEHNLTAEEAKKEFSINSYDKVNSIKVDKSKRYYISKILKRFTNRFTVLKRHLNQKKFLDIYHENKEKYDLIIFSGRLLDSSEYYDHKEELLKQEPNTLIYHNGEPDRNIQDKHPLYKILISGRNKLTELRAEVNIFNSKYSRNENSGQIIYPPVNSEFDFSEGNGMVSLSRISPEKNIKAIIEASKKAEKELVILGEIQDKKYHQELKKSLSDNPKQKIIGNPSRKDITHFLEKARFGYVGRCETFGIVTVEYMKSGTLPLVKACGANTELVEFEELQFDNTVELDSIIKRLEDNEMKRKKCRKYIYKRKKDFSTQKFREEIRELVSSFN